jgi:sortase (surface protein transpeptidase)
MKKSLVISLIVLFSVTVASPVFATIKEKVKTEQTSKEGDKKECPKKKECTKKAECPKKKACAEKKPCCKK